MTVGRFQVMATLQAARAVLLGLSVGQAKSWGLNRAIFYAAAKRGFKEMKIIHRTPEEIQRKPVQKTGDAYFLGDEVAYMMKKGGRLYFTMGGKAQTEHDFQQQIERRFGAAFSKAWSESLEIMRQYPKELLLSQSGFFEQIYRPRRDELASKWTEMSLT